MDANPKVIMKLQKLFALAEGNPNEEEANNAMLAAQRLMMQYNVAPKDIPVTKDEVSRRVCYWIDRRFPWWYGVLAKLIGDNFRCRYFIGRRGRSHGVMFVGLPADTEIAGIVFNFIREQTVLLADKYARALYQKGTPMKGLRDEYTKGFLRGLEQGFNEQVYDNNWGLMLVIHPVVQEYVDNLEVTESVTPYQPHVHPDEFARAVAQAQGYNDGREVGKSTQDGNLNKLEEEN